MKIAEIFYSIQGEGMLVGVPSAFVRTSGCNLRCVWCDTPYTSWSPEGNDMSVEGVLAEVLRYPAAHVVVTGGEPMIAPEIVALTAGLRAAAKHITIETAGTVFGAVQDGVQCDLMSISPKLRNSTPLQRDGGKWAAQHERLRYQPAVLRRLMDQFPHQLKFVIANPDDLVEVREIVAKLGAEPRNIVLMPEGTAAGTLRERAQWLVEIAKQEGFRYSPRLHIDLWGDVRGV